METSPFKFLDYYEQKDIDRFFGRQREIAQLYNAVFADNLTLLYGASGIGKTSLVRCGLGNKFYDTDWLPLFITRGSNLNDSLRRAVAAGLAPGRADAAGQELPELLRQLYLDHYRTIYLIFDQFEELFTQGGADEQAEFYETIQDVLRAGLQTKVLIVIREEWLAHLSDFERVIPTLFSNRLRVEPIREPVLWRVVIPGIVRAAGIELREPAETVSLLIGQIKDPRSGVDLTDLQVYLDRLYRRALEKQGAAAVAFDRTLVRDVGEIKGVLAVFLTEQLQILEQRLRDTFGLDDPAGIPGDILYALITNDQTKRALSPEEIRAQLPPYPGLTPEVVDFCLRELTRLRILNLLE